MKAGHGRRESSEVVGYDLRNEAGFLLAGIMTQQFQGSSVLAQQSLRTSAAALFSKGLSAGLLRSMEGSYSS